MGSALLWRPDSLWRRPEWRWLRAGYLVETGRRLDRRIDDDWVVVARDALLGCGGRRSMAAAVGAAHNVWTGDLLRRAHVEARLLTDESFAAIAARFGLPAGVVEAFEAVFFAVRGERERRATDWVARVAVGYSPFAGFTQPLPSAAWRLAAWTGGPVLLDVIRAVTVGGPLPAGRAAGPDPAARETLVRLRGEVWLALAAATSDADFAHAVRLRRQLRTQEGPLLGRISPATAVEDTMERFVLAVPSRLRTANAGTNGDETAAVDQTTPGNSRPMVSDGIAVSVSGDDIRAEIVTDSAPPHPSGVGGNRRRAG